MEENIGKNMGMLTELCNLLLILLDNLQKYFRLPSSFWMGMEVTQVHVESLSAEELGTGVVTWDKGTMQDINRVSSMQIW